MLNPESWKLSREDIINTFGIGRKKKYISFVLSLNRWLDR